MAPRGQRPCSPCSSLALSSLVASRARDAVVKTAEPAPLPSAGLPYGPAVRRAWQPGARCWAWKDDAGVGGAPGRARMARAEAWGGGLRAHSGPAWARAGRGWQGPGGGRLAQAAVVLVASPGRVVALGGSPGWKLVRGHCGVTRECGCGGLSRKRAGGLCGPGGLRDRARESGARSAPGEWALLSPRRWVPGVQFEVPVGLGVGVLGRDVWVRRELRNSGT